jgi:formylglycine-generating enzyme required for sulfatase activity
VDWVEKLRSGDLYFLRLYSDLPSLCQSFGIDISLPAHELNQAIYNSLRSNQNTKLIFDLDCIDCKIEEKTESARLRKATLTFAPKSNDSKLPPSASATIQLSFILDGGTLKICDAKLISSLTGQESDNKLPFANRIDQEQKDLMPKKDPAKNHAHDTDAPRLEMQVYEKLKSEWGRRSELWRDKRKAELQANKARPDWTERDQDAYRILNSVILRLEQIRQCVARQDFSWYKIQTNQLLQDQREWEALVAENNEVNSPDTDTELTKSEKDANPNPANVYSSDSQTSKIEVLIQKPDPKVVQDKNAFLDLSELGRPWKVRHSPSGINLVLVPPGVYTMGSPPEEENRGSDEIQHSVSIEQPFYLGEIEVTQAQWQTIMGYNPSHFIGELFPVENMSFEQIQEFLKKAGAGLRLPTENEWEYACRASSKLAFCFGNTIQRQQANFFDNQEGSHKNASLSTHAESCGKYSANRWGLHDMHGNVWELCQDLYRPYRNDDFLPSRLASSPRVMRGGSWFDSLAFCRSAKRGQIASDGRSKFVGFRVALNSTQIR